MRYYQWWTVCIDEGIAGWVWAYDEDEAIIKSVQMLLLVRKLGIVVNNPDQIDVTAVGHPMRPFAGDA